MQKEDFTNEREQSANMEEHRLAGLEEKYRKELEDYEEKTHFLQEHENEFEDAPGYEKPIYGMTSQSFGSETSKETEESHTKETLGETVLHAASDLLEKGKEVAAEKAGELWQGIKAEWKEDKKAFAKKALVGAAVTGAAVGLLVLSFRKKKEPALMEQLAKAM